MGEAIISRGSSSELLKRKIEYEASIRENEDINIYTTIQTIEDGINKKIIDLQSIDHQHTPLFANNIDECIDTNSLYVLPDGYIYAYMNKISPLFTNQIPLSLDNDGNLYTGSNGENGYKSNTCFDATMAESYKSNSGCTGYIPCKKGDIIYFKNLEFTPGLDGVSGVYIAMCESDFSLIAASNQYALNNYAYLIGANTKTIYEDSGYLSSIDITDKYNSGIAYIRVSATGIDENTIITVNEEIKYTSGYSWQSTGHVFIPADYEDRIIELESSIYEQDDRLNSLETNSINGDTIFIPDYIKNEADSSITRLIQTQGNRSFNLIALSDFHYYNYGDTQDNLISACKAISYMHTKMNFDAVATLGDNIPCGSGTEDNIASAHRWLKMMNSHLKLLEAPGVKQFRTPGNHDRVGGDRDDGNTPLFMPDNSIYSYISGYSRDCVMGDIPGGYGYYDFESYKLRIILLNTAECEGKGRFSTYSGYHISTKQYNWLIDTLDLSSKNNSSEWQILILSHHRADDYQEPIGDSSNYILPNILNAYKAGVSYSATRTEDGQIISCDFNGKNTAYLIGQIHGHHHNYKFSNIFLGYPDSGADATSIMAIGTPSTQCANEKLDNDGNAYIGELGKASETSFCIYSIDLDNHKIYSIYYGAGLDREIDY